jgi:hypothetical protein
MGADKRRARRPERLCCAGNCGHFRADDSGYACRVGRNAEYDDNHARWRYDHHTGPNSSVVLLRQRQVDLERIEPGLDALFRHLRHDEHFDIDQHFHDGRWINYIDDV